MRTQRFLFALLPTAALFALAACNNSNQNTSNSTDTSKTTSSTTNSTQTSAVVSTPQNVLVVRHKVADFTKWKMVYDGHDTARVAAGIHSYVIGRGLQDSNTVLVVMRVDDTAKAMAFGKDPGLKAAMKKGGVIGAPSIHLITVVYDDTSSIATNLRSEVTFTVKDWDAWQKAFEAGKQDRANNGLAVRAYGHEAANNHNVGVVTALIDSAKAMAYFKSDVLKKRMQESGVTGQPERFLYRIVQVYR